MINATMPRKRGTGRPKKHGGARLGAGRPRLAGVGTQVVAATLMSAHVAKVEAWMERHEAPNLSAALREMIDIADRVDRST